MACLLAAMAGGCAQSEALTCADMVVVDWNNGRLDSTYPPGCYREALEALSEDARLYTAAPEDIKRALRESLAARAYGRERAKEQSRAQATDAGAKATRELSGRHRARTTPRPP